MANIGSVFLGDVQRYRVFSTSTPPSSPPASSIYTSIPSPPPITGSSGDDHNNIKDDIEGETATTATASNTMTAPRTGDENLPKGTTTIDPMLALELRMRWLEAIVLGVPENNPGHPISFRNKARSTSLRSNKRSISGAEGKATLLKHGETLVRLAKDVRSRLDAIVEANEGLKRFMAQCERYINCCLILTE